MNRYRWIALVVAVVLAPLVNAGLARAQVAAPSLIPGTADVIISGAGQTADPSFVPLNPAVMSWNKGSVFGLGEAKIDRDQKSPTKQSEEYGTTYGGFRWTGDTLAIGLETLNLESDKNNVNLTYKSTGGGVSGTLADWFALGGGLDSQKADAGSSHDSTSRLIAGGSAKIGDLFYVGAGVGRDSLDHKDSSGKFSDDRSITEYGLALYTGGRGAGSAIWHLEYNLEDRDDYTATGGTKFGGFSRTNGVIEVNWSNILLSYTAYSTSAKTGNGTVDGTAFEAGWAPQKSFFITGRLQYNTEKNGSTKLSDGNSMSINVGFQI